jgi:hypothetical protein
MNEARTSARQDRRRRSTALQRWRGAAWLAWFAFVSTAVGAQSPAFAPSDETPEQFPAGIGRDETFYAGTACHNFKLVAAQGMSRPQWEDTLAWMTQRHGMPLLERTERDRVLDYLETTFPPQPPQGRGGWRNPFAPR